MPKPNSTAPKVIMEATDRSMPPVTTTNVWSTVSTTRIAEATSIERMFPLDRKVGLTVWKITTSTTIPTAAAQSAQNAPSRSTAPSAGARLGLLEAASGWVTVSLTS